NVDLRHDCLSRGWSDCEHAAAFAAELRCDRNRSPERGGSLSMAAKPIIGALEAPFVERRRLVDYDALSDYWAITKPEVNFLILITTFVGFYMGREAPQLDFPFLLLINAMLGTFLVASGAGTLNQYIERRFDAQMRRTARRPLAAGRLNASAVCWFGVAL